MLFHVTNVRTNISRELTSQQLKDKIITQTNSRYENVTVSPERTGLRPVSIQDTLSRLDHVNLHKGIFIVTALARVNNNRNSRYMILIDGDEYDPRIVQLFQDYVSIYSVKYMGGDDVEGQMSSLSHWFRTNMGRAFSFIDIDYLMANNNFSRVISIEEKIGKSGVGDIGYGQLISYKELITDIIKVPSLILFIFSVENANANTRVKFYPCGKNSFNGNSLTNRTLEVDTLGNIANRIKRYLDRPRN